MKLLKPDAQTESFIVLNSRELAYQFVKLTQHTMPDPKEQVKYKYKYR